MRGWLREFKCELDTRREPLTRLASTRRATLSHKGRGEESYTRGMLTGRTSRDWAASLIPALAAPKPW